MKPSPISLNHYICGAGKTRVHLCHVKFFCADFIYIFGGRAHLGALTFFLNIFSEKIFKTLKLPHHRDDVVTKKVTNILAKTLSGPLIVSAGIHYDPITKKQIAAIVKNCEKLADLVCCP